MGSPPKSMKLVGLLIVSSAIFAYISVESKSEALSNSVIKKIDEKLTSILDILEEEGTGVVMKPGIELESTATATGDFIGSDCPHEQDCPSENEMARMGPESVRIVKGCVVPPNSMPWQVAITRPGCDVVPSSSSLVPRGGGTIISAKYVMTAAKIGFGHRHDCKTDFGKDDIVVEEFRVMVGAHDFYLNKTIGIEHKIKNHYPHPLFDRSDPHPPLADYDYAIYELEKKIELKHKWAMAVFLPTKRDHLIEKGIRFAVSGWGQIDKDNSPTNISSCPWAFFLNAVNVYSVPHPKCKDIYKKEKREITLRMKCAINTLGMGKGSCWGDGGGPLTWLDPETDEVKLVGIVSAGYNFDGCHNTKLPGIYANVRAELDWIEDIIGDSNDQACGNGFCQTGQQLDKTIKANFYQKRGAFITVPGIH